MRLGRLGGDGDDAGDGEENGFGGGAKTGTCTVDAFGGISCARGLLPLPLLPTLLTLLLLLLPACSLLWLTFPLVLLLLPASSLLWLTFPLLLLLPGFGLGILCQRSGAS